MVMNRLIKPKSEHAMPSWICTTALNDILGEEFSNLSDDSLYRNLDRLYPLRSQIEDSLSVNERTLFNLEQTIFFYDLTSTYFEGQAHRNPKAKRGYSRDKRPDCPQVVVGLVINRDGFPLCHEIFQGNVKDTQTLNHMLDLLAERVKIKRGQTVVVDRGMSYESNLLELKRRGLNYIVASRQSEREKWLAEFDDYGEYEEVVRQPSITNPSQKKSRVRIQLRRSEGETYVLCISDARREKDRAIREKKGKRLLADLHKLERRIRSGKLKDENKISEAVGRLKERYPRVARYYKMMYDKKKKKFEMSVDLEKMEKAERLDGAYLLKSSRMDLNAQEIWKIYMFLTRAENAFRDMKSPLSERPIFHQLQQRVETHIFLCILAYHLLVAIEKKMLDKGRHTSWETIREALATHQVATVVLPTTNGAELRIRQDSVAEDKHKEIYKTLEVPYKIMKPVKTWESKKIRM
jgi:transposase